MRAIIISILMCAGMSLIGCSHLVKNESDPNGGNGGSEAVNTEKPTGKLTYCSYASIGHAALGTDYCELIADPGKKPKIVVVLNEDCHFADKVKKEFEVSQDVVEKAEKGLEELKAWEINGYNKTELMDGGRSRRVHIEYGAEEKVHAHWFTHQAKREAIAVYNYLESFFSPWREKVEQMNEDVDVVEEVEE